MNAPVNVGELDRATYVGGSRVAAILGLDPYGKTPLTEYLSIVGELDGTIDEERRKFFEWRKEWEPVVIKRVVREFDAKVVNVNQRYRDQEYDFLAAEIDAEWLDESGAEQNLEVKTCHPLSFNERGGWGDAGTGDVPVHYAAQCMHGLGVTGRQTCILVAMAGIDTFVFYRIDRDQETIDEMRARCITFWTEHVLKRIPPDPVTLEDCMRLMDRIKGRSIEADDDLLEDLRSLKGIRESMAAMAGEKNELMTSIAVRVLKTCAEENAPAIDDKMIITRKGKDFCSWNLQKTTRIDPKALRESMPEIFAQFSKTTSSRVLRFKQEKKA